MNFKIPFNSTNLELFKTSSVDVQGNSGTIYTHHYEIYKVKDQSSCDHSYEVVIYDMSEVEWCVSASLHFEQITKAILKDDLIVDSPNNVLWNVCDLRKKHFTSNGSYSTGYEIYFYQCDNLFNLKHKWIKFNRDPKYYGFLMEEYLHSEFCVVDRLAYYESDKYQDLTKHLP